MIQGFCVRENTDYLAWRWSRQRCARWGPSSISQKKGRSPPPNLRPIFMWRNGWIHQDATWYGGRPQPRRLCVRWGPSFPPQKGRSPQFSAHVYCGQTVAWIKMPLGTEVGLGLHNIVLALEGAQPPIFGQCPLWPNGLMDNDATWCGGRPRPRRLCVRWEPSYPQKKGTSTRPNF